MTGSEPNLRPRLSIVFINYNTTDLLAAALDSLAECRPGFPVEVIVVDNASQDRADLTGTGWNGSLRVIRNERNLGYGRAANQGIRRAQGDFVAIANPDLVFLPGVLDRLVEFLDSRPDAGIVSPQFLWADMSAQPSARRMPSLRYAFSGRRSVLTRLFPGRRSTQEFLYAGIEDAEQAVPVEAVIGAFMVCPRALIETLGGFDERYFMFVEDIDLCRRVSRLGRGVYVLPRARMIHLGGAAREKAEAWIDHARLRSFYSFLKAESRTRVLLLALFSGYLALLLAGRALGLREWEYSFRARAGAARA
jgi:hypothetical protein